MAECPEGDGIGEALIGFDDLELAERFKVLLSVISHNPTEMGLQATALLFRRLQGDAGPITTIVLPAELIARGSAEIPPRGEVSSGPAPARRRRAP